MRVSRRVDPSLGCPIKGSASAEASGAAHSGRAGLGGTWMRGGDLLSCYVKWARQSRHRYGSGGWGVRRSCRCRGRRCTADCPSDTPAPGKSVGCHEKSDHWRKKKVSWLSALTQTTERENCGLTCLFGGGRASLGGFWVWVGGQGGGGVSWRLGLVTEEDVELQRDRFEYPVRGW